MHIKNYNRMATLSILGISAILLILIQITLVDAAQDLTRYYNCVTMDANNQGSSSLAGVEICYGKAPKGVQNADDDGKPLR